MTQTATRRGAKTAAARETVTELEVGAKGAAALNGLAGARLERLLAERAEKPLKEAVAALWAGHTDDMEPGDVIVVKAQGVVRGKITLKRRGPKVDLELLQEAFPEAFEKCVDTEVHTPQFDPA